MGTNLFNELETLRPSAAKLREGTNWPDWLIDDYLTLLNNLINFAQTIDNTTSDDDERFDRIDQELGSLQAQVGNLRANIAALFKADESIQESLDKLNQSIQGISNGLLFGLISGHEKRIKKLEQQVV